MRSEQVSKVINFLDKERIRAIEPYYTPVNNRLENWIKLRDTDPDSIQQNAPKKRANRYMRLLSNHSVDLFTLCALAMAWTTLGEVRIDDGVTEVIQWWNTVQKPSCLRDIYRDEFPDRASKRARTSETFLARSSAESNDPFPSTHTKGIKAAELVTENSTEPVDIQHNISETATFTATMNPENFQQPDCNPLLNRIEGFEAEVQAKDLFNFLLTYDGGCKLVQMTCPFREFQLPSMTITFKSSNQRDIRIELSHSLCSEILKNVPVDFMKDI